MEDEKASRSYVRWQGITIKQMTYSINLILGFATGLLAYEVNLIINPNLNLTSNSKCFFLVSLLLILFSMFFGLWCVINRLKDFRKTAKIARKREKNETDNELESLRNDVRNLGKWTWILFNLQIFCFGLGFVFLLTSVVIQYHSKLF